MPSPRTPRLLRPVGPTSVVVPVPTTRYTECDGTPVVYDPVSRVFQPLTPVGAAVWARLDGRSVAALVDELARLPGAPPSTPVDVVEVVRRLRAVGLAEDADPAAPAGVPVRAEGVATAAVRLRGRVEPVTEPSGAAPAVGSTHGPTSGAPAGTEVLLDPGTDAEVTVDPARPPVRFVSAGEGHEGPLAPLDALRELADAAAPGVLDPADGLDALADLAERVEVVRRLPGRP